MVTEIQNTGKIRLTTGEPSLDIPFASPPTPGNLIIIPAWARKTADDILPLSATACRDNQGNLYRRAIWSGSDPDVEFFSYRATVLYYAYNIGTPVDDFIVTIDLPGAGQDMISGGIEFAGIGMADPLDTVASFHNVGDPQPYLSGNTGALRSADSVAVAAFGHDSSFQDSKIIGVSGSYNSFIEEVSNASGDYLVGQAAYKFLSSNAAQEVEWTWDGIPADPFAVIAVFMGGEIPTYNTPYIRTPAGLGVFIQ